MRSQLATIVLGALSLLGSAACPGGTAGLERARNEADEVSAIASLRAIVSAQLTFQAVCGGGLSAPSLKTLAQPSAGSPNGFLGADLATDPSVKRGYTIALVPGPTSTEAPASCNGLAAGLAVRDYFVSASPSAAGASYFAAMGDGRLYRSPQPIAPTFGTPPPAPAVPVQ